MKINITIEWNPMETTMDNDNATFAYAHDKAMKAALELSDDLNARHAFARVERLEVDH